MHESGTYPWQIEIENYLPFGMLNPKYIGHVAEIAAPQITMRKKFAFNLGPA